MGYPTISPQSAKAGQELTFFSGLPTQGDGGVAWRGPLTPSQRFPSLGWAGAIWLPLPIRGFMKKISCCLSLGGKRSDASPWIEAAATL